MSLPDLRRRFRLDGDGMQPLVHFAGDKGVQPAVAIDAPRLPIPVYVLVWIVLSAVGMKVQFMGHKKPADNDD